VDTVYLRFWHFTIFAALQHIGRYWHLADMQVLAVYVRFRG
jgi:hypothetical protein